MPPKYPKRVYQAADSSSEWSYSFASPEPSPEPPPPPPRLVEVTPQTEEDSAVAAALELTEAKYGPWRPPAEIIDIGEIEEEGVPVVKDNPWSIAGRAAQIREKKRRTEQEERGIGDAQTGRSKPNSKRNLISRPSASNPVLSKVSKPHATPTPTTSTPLSTIEEGTAREPQISLALRPTPISQRTPTAASAPPSMPQSRPDQHLPPPPMLPNQYSSSDSIPRGATVSEFEFYQDKNVPTHSARILPKLPSKHELPPTPRIPVPRVMALPTRQIQAQRPPQDSSRPPQRLQPPQQRSIETINPAYRQYNPSRSDTSHDEWTSSAHSIEDFNHSRPASPETAPSSPPLPPPAFSPRIKLQSKPRPFKPLRPLSSTRRPVPPNFSLAGPEIETVPRPSPPALRPPVSPAAPLRPPLPPPTPIVSPIPTRPSRLHPILSPSHPMPSASSSSNPTSPPPSLEADLPPWTTLSRHLLPTPSPYGSSLPTCTAKGSTSALVTRFTLPLESRAPRGRGIGIGLERGRGRGRGGAFRAGMNFAPRESLGEFRNRLEKEREEDEEGGSERQRQREERRLRDVYSSMDF